MELEKTYKRYVAIIPARAGSKRLPRKNMMKIQGKPLIGVTIATALELLEASSIIVTTDDLEVLDYAGQFGVNCHERNPLLAMDGTPTSDVLRDLDDLVGSFDFLILLQPTSPLRNVRHLNEAIELFEELHFQPIASGVRLEVSKLRLLYAKDDQEQSHNASCLPMEAHKLNGAIYIARISQLKESSWDFSRLQSQIYEMPEYESIDIDTKEDFFMAENLLSRNTGPGSL